VRFTVVQIRDGRPVMFSSTDVNREDPGGREPQPEPEESIRCNNSVQRADSRFVIHSLHPSPLCVTYIW
jgi:hypothetical protein